MSGQTRERSLNSLRSFAALALSTLAIPAWAANHLEVPLISLGRAVDHSDVFIFSPPSRPEQIFLTGTVVNSGALAVIRAIVAGVAGSLHASGSFRVNLSTLPHPTRGSLIATQPQVRVDQRGNVVFSAYGDFNPGSGPPFALPRSYLYFYDQQGNPLAAPTQLGDPNKAQFAPAITTSEDGGVVAGFAEAGPNSLVFRRQNFVNGELDSHFIDDFGIEQPSPQAPFIALSRLPNGDFVQIGRAHV